MYTCMCSKSRMWHEMLLIMNTCKAPVSAKHDARGALDNYTFKQKNDCEKDEF